MLQSALKPTLAEVERLRGINYGRVPHAVGGSCIGGKVYDPAGSGRDACWRGYAMCDLQRVCAVTTAAGGAEWLLEFDPNQGAYFEPVAVRMVVTNDANCLETYRTKIHSVTVNDIPQEATNFVTGLTSASPGWWSDDYQDPDDYGIPVGWTWFSNISNSRVLRVRGFNAGTPAGVTLQIQMTVLGNLLDSRPTDPSLQPRSCRPGRQVSGGRPMLMPG